MHASGWLMMLAVRGSPTPRPTRRPTPVPRPAPTPAPTYVPSYAPTVWNCTSAALEQAAQRCGSVADLARFCQNVTNATLTRALLTAASLCSDDDEDDEVKVTDFDTFRTAAVWVLGGLVFLVTLFVACAIARAARWGPPAPLTAEAACRAGAYWTPRDDDDALRIAR